MRTKAHTQTDVLLALLIGLSSAAAQMPFPPTPTLGLHQAGITAIFPSNSVSHIAVGRGVLWIGTGKGLARSSADGRSWVSYAGLSEFADPGIYAIAVRGDTIWSSTGFTKDVDNQSVQTGSGYTYSLNDGATWISRPQTSDAANDSLVQYGKNTVRFIPIIVREQNVTFGISLGDTLVWIASWSSGLRRSSDMGANWQRVVLPAKTMNSISPRDSLPNYTIDPRLDNNYLVFSVLALGNSVVWAGSAGGVNRSTDGGVSWVKFTTDNQNAPILGNWVIAIGAQQRGTNTRIWTTNWPADDQNQQYGVSYTDDGGDSWRNMLIGVKAYAFAFRDSIAYVAAEDGLYRTADGGNSWIRSGSIIDQGSGQRITSDAFYAVGVIADTVYGGTGDGLVRTLDNATHLFGQSWEISRSYFPIGNRSSAYAYPNPFSPKSEVTRLHYSTGGTPATVTIEIFDFGMNRVRTIIRDAQRTGTLDHDEIWDGRDASSAVVPNGVYFYRIIMSSSDPLWGKILVLQ